MSYNAVLRQRVEEVESTTGSGTALISLYVPADKNLASVRTQMAQEQSEADNIKSDSNRKNVKKALSRVERVLKRYKQTPENGLIVFVGITDDDDVKEFVFDELSQPLEYSDYICDNQFNTDPLRERLAPDNSIGLLVVERGGAVIGELRGTRVVCHQVIESNVMGKHNAGGQCLVPGTQVKTPDGSKPLDYVRVGDTVTAVDFEKGEMVQTEVTDVWEEQKHVRTVRPYGGPRLEGSADHSVFVSNKETIDQKEIGNLSKTAEDLDNADLTSHLLRVSDAVAVQDGSVETSDDLLVEKMPIRDIEDNNHERKERVIDISTEQANFIANGYIVHNSAERFDRLIEEQKDHFFNSISDRLAEQFIDDDNRAEVDAFIIGGTQVTVDNFVSDGFLPHALKDVRAGGSFSVDLANGKQSLEQLVSRAQTVIDEVESQEEREATRMLFKSLHDDDLHATYGEDEIQRALEYGAVSKLLVTQNKDPETIAEYQEAVGNQGGELVIVSTDFEKGEQLEKAFGGIAALLRYQID